MYRPGKNQTTNSQKLMERRDLAEVYRTIHSDGPFNILLSMGYHFETIIEDEA